MSTLHLQTEEADEEVMPVTSERKKSLKRFPSHRLPPLTRFETAQASRVELQKLADLFFLFSTHPDDDQETFNAKIIKLRDRYESIAPSNSIEAMLAVQMIGSNEAILGCLHRAAAPKIPPKLRLAELSMAERLLRTSILLADALGRQKGASNKTVTVEYVNREPPLQRRGRGRQASRTDNAR